MSFIESPRFPTTLSYHSSGGPMWKTQVVQTTSGREQRIQTWQDALRRWDAMAGVKTDAQIDELQAWFLIAAGMANGFRFKDWKDYSASSNNGVGIVNATGLGNGTTAGQLYKRYTIGSYSYTRKIVKPVAGTVSVFKNGTALTIGSGTNQFQLNTSTGIVTFYGAAPASSDVLTWSGEFDVPARFDTDTFSASYEELNASSVSLPIVEIRL